MTRRRCSPRHPCCPPCHYDLVDSYRAARQADIEHLEQATALYPSEVREYRAQHQLITFKQWLIGSARRSEQAA